MANQRCWFCEKRDAGAAYSVEVPLYRSEDVKEEWLTHKKKRVTWAKRTIYVPSCSRCDRASKLGCLRTIICVPVGLLVMGGVLGILIPLFDEPTIPVIAGVACGVLAGFGFIKGFNFLVTRSVGNEGWKKNQNDYPAVVAAVEEGWTVGTPPEAYESY